MKGIAATSSSHGGRLWGCAADCGEYRSYDAGDLLCQFGSIGTRVSRIGFNPGYEARLIERSFAAPTIGFHALKGQQLEYAWRLEAAAHRQGANSHSFPVLTLGTQRHGRD